MRRLFISAAMATMLGAMIPASQAATVSQPFNVTVTLTSVCTMATIGNLAFGTYVAFQGTAQTATPTTATLTCTRGLTGVTANFDTAAPGSTAATAATNAVGAGVIAGLEYNITATPGGTGTAAGTAATASSIGTAATMVYDIAGTMPSGQAGTCTTTSCTATQARTLTVTY